MKTGAFGIKIIEFAGVNWTHGSCYGCSLYGLLILKDTAEALKWEAFWKYSKKWGERLKDQLTAIAESFESKNKYKVKIDGGAKMNSKKW